jgi:hypothetical protein
MGCSGSKGVQYTYERQKRLIPNKQAHTLHRWGMGAEARWKYQKMKKQVQEDIACKFLSSLTQL